MDLKKDTKTTKDSQPEPELETVIFTNNESPGTELQFTFKGKQHHLLHGRTYDLEADTVDHLNNLMYPQYELQLDAETQQMRSVVVGNVPRFTCHPVRRSAKQVAVNE